MIARNIQTEKPAFCRTTKAQKLLAGILAAGLVLGLAACATTQRTRSVTESGFLKDYSQLKPGRRDQAKRVYIDPSADWSKYTGVCIEPIELWHSDDPKSKLGRLSKEDQELLVNYFYTALNEHLAKDFHLVNQAGPGVLVIHCAITEAKKSRPVSNLVSSIVPYGRALSLAKRVVFGTGLGVGECQVEGEFLDGQTGQRLAAVVDRRAGTKALRSKFDGSFGDVKLAMDYWAEHLDGRMAQLRDAKRAKKQDL